MNYAGIYDVVVERVSGNLTDHYNPRSKVLRLSDATYNPHPVAAIGVAAHESVMLCRTKKLMHGSNSAEVLYR